ncbi:hypothetical protein OG984_03240 [Nocardioides sp. NBC_00368]|uniref:hypothetical protein n=1 Tax=Nocardioides sp. NBC_00368 TaxID=2976000 RepID=UPI002E1CE17A
MATVTDEDQEETDEPVPWTPDPAGIYFSDRFGVSPQSLEAFGAFDISVVSDLPVFIDPFLLFNSEKEEYCALHDQILDYLRFLRDHANEPLDPGRIKSWYTFSEVRQNWLGFVVGGNRGHGLGRKFAVALHAALGDVLDNFGEETITSSSHVEKLALIRPGVGRDTISDLTTNLIKHYLLRYTSEFAVAHLALEARKAVSVPRAKFNYNTQTWATAKYELPYTDGDFVILTPADLLTKDDTWINRSDMVSSFDLLPDVAGNDQLRSDVSNYLRIRLTRRSSDRERREVRARALLQFPELIDCYIKLKEDTGDQAAATSRDKVIDTQTMLRDQVQRAARDLADKTNLFETPWTSYDEALQAVETFKNYVENQDGWRVINRGGGKVFANETEVQGFFGLLLQPSRFDVNREANNGRGPVDFKLSMGLDKTLIEFKLAKSSALERNMERQLAVYEKANKTNSSVFVVIGYSDAEVSKAASVMRRLGLDQPDARKVVVIDASPKQSASKV